MSKIEIYYKNLLAFCGLVAGVLIGLVAIFVTLDVAIRNTGIGNLPWVLEITEYILFVSTFLAAPWVLSRGAHVRIDLVREALSPGAGRRVDIIAGAFGFVITLIIFRYGIFVTWDAWTINSVIDKELQIPEWALLCVIPFSAALLTIEFVRQISSAIRSETVSANSPLTGGI